MIVDTYDQLLHNNSEESTRLQQVLLDPPVRSLAASPPMFFTMELFDPFEQRHVVSGCMKYNIHIYIYVQHYNVYIYIYIHTHTHTHLEINNDNEKHMVRS